MPNVLLTQRCVRSCPYCFAGRHMAESRPDDFLSWEDLIYLADLFQGSGVGSFRLLGGEPTIHPHFNDMTAYLLDRGFEVMVFTSGILSDRVRDEAFSLFGNLPPERFTFLCNLNDPVQTPAPEGERRSIEKFLAAFGERTIPGFNIYRTDFRLDFLFFLIERFGLKRQIRLGLTHPILGRDNECIRPGDFDAVAARFFEHAPLFERFRVIPGFDCGFPMCRFTDEQLGWLYRITGGKNQFKCGPVVDIGPDMTVWPCFPLSSYKKRSVFEFDNLQQIQAGYEEVFRKVKVEAGGVFPECDDCPAREMDHCSGGCLAHTLIAIEKEPRVRMLEVYP